MRKKNVEESTQRSRPGTVRKEKDILLSSLKLKEINAFAGIAGTPKKAVSIETPEKRNVLNVEDYFVEDAKQEEIASAGTTPEKNEIKKKRHATPVKKKAQNKKLATPRKETEKKMLTTPQKNEFQKKMHATPEKNKSEIKKPATPKNKSEKKVLTTPGKKGVQKKSHITPEKNKSQNKKPLTPKKNSNKKMLETCEKNETMKKRTTSLSQNIKESKTGIIPLYSDISDSEMSETLPNNAKTSPKPKTPAKEEPVHAHDESHMPHVVRSSMLSLLQSDLQESDVNDFKLTRGDATNGNFGGFEYGYNYHEPEQFTNHTHSNNQVPRELSRLIEYFQQLNEDQKQVVTGFMSVISNTLQACTMQQSAFSPPSSSCSSQERFYASPSSSPLQVLQSTFSSHLSETRPIGMANALPEYEKKIPLIVDKEDDKRFKDILVNPVSLRKAEQCALINKNPGLYLLNKVASLLFTREELQAAKGVAGLNSIKQEALLEYLRAKEKSLSIPQVSHNDYRRTLQNKITNARKDVQRTLDMKNHE